jgi:predicted dehydrogenase
VSRAAEEAKTRWGILGTGRVAHDFAEDLRLVPDAVLSAVGSRNLGRAKEFALRLGIPTAHGSYEELARDGEVDVVYVATPHSRHQEDCCLCLEHSRAVLCEKPLALNAREAETIITLAQRKRLFCMEGMWMRFQPLILKVRSMVRAGVLGDVRLLSAEMGYRTPFDPRNRFFSLELGGGALMDRGVYLLSLALYLLGPPSEASGRASMGSSGVDDTAHLVLTYPNRALAVLTSSLTCRLRNEAVIVGSKGEIRIQDPFYAPRRLIWKQFAEAVRSVKEVSNHPGGLLRRVKRSSMLKRGFDLWGRPLLHLLRPDGKRFSSYFAGNGYQFEAGEVNRCLKENLTESPMMPLKESLLLLQTIDALRHSWGLHYPAD